jgi:hypothetical protein
MASRALSRFQALIGGKKTEDDDISPSPDVIQDEEKKQHAVDGVADANSGSESDPEHPSTHAQRGVQEVEAVALAWTKGALIFVFVK